jgi:hypothetical protein
MARIANALEEIIYQQWGYRMQPPAPYTGQDESGVDYATEETTLKTELLNVKKGRRADALTEED